MAKMIPDSPYEETKSSAEKIIFNLFRDAPETDDWIVLHSYRVATNKLETEIDFIVLAPELGIFGIEVKGGIISRENGEWYSTNKWSKRNKIGDPFRQAQTAIHDIMGKYENKIGDFAFGYGVMFPDMKLDEITGKEISKWQIFDRENNKDVVTFIRNLSENTPNKSRKKPNRDEVNLVARVLRSDIKYNQSDLIRMADGKLHSLTEDQKEILDSLKDNVRIVIEGPAGTGKTILAIEAAKRAAQQGMKTAIFCYNTLISEWIKKQVESETNIVVNTIHDFMIGHIKSTGVPFVYKGRNFLKDWKIIKETGILWNWDSEPSLKKIYDNDNFWGKGIPQMMLKALKDKPVKIDKIILDEAQDLIKGDYLDVVDKMLKGGLSNGEWIAFADFYQDVIRVEYDPAKAREVLRSNGAPAIFRLSENCRNTIAIGKQIENLMEFDLKYKFTDIACPEVDFHEWPDNKKELQAGKLNNILKDLEKNRIKRKDIVVLFAQTSIDSNSESLLSESAKSQLKGFTFAPYGTGKDEEIAFTSAGKFKGMESPVVILLDVDSYLKNDEVRNLMYVGLSRARTLLIVLESNEAKNERMTVGRKIKF